MNHLVVGKWWTNIYGGLSKSWNMYSTSYQHNGRYIISLSKSNDEFQSISQKAVKSMSGRK